MNITKIILILTYTGILKRKMMKQIFMTLIGMTFIIALFLTFQALIISHAPGLEQITSVAKGFVGLILIMGGVIIFKTAFELVQICLIKK